MATQGFSQQLFAQVARIGKAVASGHRLKLLELLAQGERSVEALAQAAGLSMANASQHLQQLRQCGLVDARRSGQHVYYRIAAAETVDLVELMRRIAETHLHEVDELIESYLSTKDALEALPARTLLQRAQAGTVTVVDVRPEEEYSAGHVPGAVNIPLEELERRLPDLPQDGEIVAYCRGPYCILAYEAVATLRAHGYEARRLEHGFPEWKQAGFPVQTPESSDPT